MKQIILPVTVHLNIRLPLALLQPEPAAGAHRPGAGGPCLPVLRQTAGSASMKKSKPEPYPRHGLPPVPQSAGGWYMSAATMTAATVSRWMMGRNVSVSSPFPTPCCAGGSGRRCCRWTENWKRPCSTAWTPKRCVVLRGAVHTRLQPGQILPGMCCSGTPPQGGRTTAEKIPSFYAFRGRKPLVNQGLFRGCRPGA